MTPAPYELRCEYLKDPMGVDAPHPGLSWILVNEGRNQFQRAYQIIVSRHLAAVLEETGECWNTGRRESAETVNIPYTGKPLESGVRYFWRVRVWEGDGDASPYSRPAFFETGILSQKEWKGSWVGMKKPREFRTRGTVMMGRSMGEYVQTHCVYLRKELSLAGRIRRARAYVCGLGWYELRINGLKVGDRVLEPAQTDYRRTGLYSTYDVTHLLQDRNAIGVMLGNGRHIPNFGYGPPRMILQIHVEYDTGEGEVIVSDRSWKAAHGPLIENGMYSGEVYDARRELRGWDRPGFSDARWEKAAVLEGPKLSSQMMPPVRVTEKLLPVKLTSPSRGVYIYDFGQNFTGWVRLTVRGRRGTVLKLRHAELLNEDGTLNVLPNQNAGATDIYILKGGGTESYEPRFTYHGFRYAELTGFPGVPTLSALEGRVVHTDVERTGEFFCSNDIINSIHRNVLWGQRSNLMGIPTDCPQRDERHGWMADAHLSAEEAMFNFGMAAFYRKFLCDIRLSQRKDGSLPDAVPPYIRLFYPADPAWASAYITIAWQIYMMYGDKQVLREHFPCMQKYVEFLRRNARRGHILWKLGKYGDWCPPGSIASERTPLELTSTWFYYSDVLTLSEIAGAIGAEKEKRRYIVLARKIKDAFNRQFLKGDRYTLPAASRADTSTDQTSNVLPLYLKMVPPGGAHARVLAKLLENLLNVRDCHLDTGILGTRYLLDVLVREGYAELAYRVATQKTYPGWGYMVAEGATTLWERWENIAGGGMNSHNHIMLGSVDAWFYRAIAGVVCVSPGWSCLRIQPRPVGDLRFASAALRTVKGELRVSWERTGRRFSINVLIPVGAEAEVCVPLPDPKSSVTESGLRLWDPGRPRKSQVSGIKFLSSDGQTARFHTGSGSYVFVAESHN